MQPTAPTPSPTVWFAVGLGLLAGMALQMRQPSLGPVWSHAALLVAGLGLLPLVRRVARLWTGTWQRLGSISLAALLATALGWGWAGGRAAWRLADELTPVLEGKDVVVEGVVASLPVERVDGLRFVFEVDSATAAGQPAAVPHRVSIGWYGGSVREVGPDASLAAGQRWRFAVRLKRPHGGINPHGFDYEMWLFEQGIRATGYVRDGASAQRLQQPTGCCAWAIERLRQHVRDALHRRLGDSAQAGLLAALSIGDQAAIARDDWQVFRITGVAHLVAISGLHITMFAWLAARLGGWTWRRSPALMWRCPASQAARWLGVLAAWLYALVAGWGVPAQRTVCMLLVACVLRQAGVRWPWPAQLLGVAVVVCLADPWALLQPGFWLSFVAVAVLMADGDAASPANDAVGGGPRARIGTALRRSLRAQALASLVLAPLTMLLFQQASVVGFVANLIAIPVVTLLLTPLALLGMVVPPLWSVAAWLAQGWMASLAWLAQWPWASWWAAAPPTWAVVLALVALLVLAAPLPVLLRGLGLFLALPLFLPFVVRPAPGAFTLLAADVGQGNAVLVRTAAHDLLYDAGPQYSRDNDAGHRVLVPLLSALGTRRLDLLMLSHRDTDHVGGAASVLSGIGAHRLSSSLEPGHPLRRWGVPHQPCAAGQRWQWDAVRFEVLHPPVVDAVAARANTVSCVLRIESASGHVALLTGDIEQAQEQALALADPAQLRADVLLVPHHGSKTSSSAAWLDAVQPRWAVVQAGYRNRFGHPAPEVVARYDQRRIAMVRTDRCGAWSWSSVDQKERCARVDEQRYWHTMSAGDVPP